MRITPVLSVLLAATLSQPLLAATGEREAQAGPRSSSSGASAPTAGGGAAHGATLPTDSSQPPASTTMPRSGQPSPSRQSSPSAGTPAPGQGSTSQGGKSSTPGGSPSMQGGSAAGQGSSGRTGAMQGGSTQGGASQGSSSQGGAAQGGEKSANQFEPDNTGRNRDHDRRVEAEDQSNNAADVQLVSSIRRALTDDSSLSLHAHNVKIIVQGGRVTLRGPVKGEAEKRKVEAIARKAAGKHQVVNELEATGR